MALIVDTDVIIRGERGLFDLPAWLESQADANPQIAAITIAELWHGLERATAAHKPRREAYLQMIIEIFPVLPYTESTALEHARIWAELESSGKMIGYYDLIVAATAIEHGSALATFNERHFAFVRIKHRSAINRVFSVPPLLIFPPRHFQTPCENSSSSLCCSPFSPA